jgi:hypothetical protein
LANIQGGHGAAAHGQILPPIGPASEQVGQECDPAHGHALIDGCLWIT